MQIRNNMFVSCRGINNTNLKGAWNFDGNLLNFTSTTGINGTFSNGGANNCRFSGYINDSVTGPYSSLFMSHSTVINRTGTPNPFPGGFLIKSPFLTIPDNNPAGITDTINISGTNESVTSVEVFLSVQHTYVGDLLFILTAPNGQARSLSVGSGGSGDNVLTFFSDDFTYLPSSAVYLPPWGYLKPILFMGNFGGSPVQGTWKLLCADLTSGDIGVLCGWGIRINNLVGVQPKETELPQTFSLYQNYPNPFNPSTKIKFDIPARKDDFINHVKLEIIDILGRVVDVLINDEMKPGKYEINWDASKFSSGIYFYKLTAGNFSDTKKMALIK
jgi:subtilisin-like proprotein convertase family protein